MVVEGNLDLDGTFFTIRAGAELVPGYHLIRKLGQGGFGEVWEAEAPGGVHIALKLIRLESNAAAPERRALEIIRNVRHPHLLDIQFALQRDDHLIIAMPLCDQNLMDRLRECQNAGLPAIPVAELMGYMEETARAIDFLNEHRHRGPEGTLIGIQHRDIKPHNIFLVGGSVRVADFGIAKILEDNSASHTGNMSVDYVAPEIFTGYVHTQSDQYSLGVTYYQLRTGLLPFKGAMHAIMLGHSSLPPDLSGLSSAERQVVARVLAKRPEDRFRSCQEFVAGLKKVVPLGSPQEEAGAWLGRLRQWAGQLLKQPGADTGNRGKSSTVAQVLDSKPPRSPSRPGPLPQQNGQSAADKGAGVPASPGQEQNSQKATLHLPPSTPAAETPQFSFDALGAEAESSDLSATWSPSQEASGAMRLETPQTPFAQKPDLSGGSHRAGRGLLWTAGISLACLALAAVIILIVGLNPGPKPITVSIDPPDANVTIDGRPRQPDAHGQITLEPKRRSAYAIRVTHSDYQDFDSRLTPVQLSTRGNVIKLERRKVSPAPDATGHEGTQTISLSIEPPDANVTIDGHPRRLDAGRLTLEPKEESAYTIKVTHSDYEDFADSLTPAQLNELGYAIKLKRRAVAPERKQTITVSLDPPDASVTIDGRPRQLDAGRLTLEPKQGSAYEITATHSGYEDFTASLTPLELNERGNAIKLKEIPDPLLPQKALAVLARACLDCHQWGDNVLVTAFDVLDPKSLTAAIHDGSALVVPGKPDQSALLRWATKSDDDHPVGPQAPDAASLALLRRWIEKGASFPPVTESRPFRSEKEVLEAIENDLTHTEKGTRKYLRYFTLTNLHNQPSCSEADLRRARAALFQVINAESKKSVPVYPKAIDSDRTILRVDMRDLGWDRNNWKEILARYPYALTHDSPFDPSHAPALAIDDLLSPDLPFTIRADWFIAARSSDPRPDLIEGVVRDYERDLDLPTIASELGVQNLDSLRAKLAPGERDQEEIGNALRVGTMPRERWQARFGDAINLLKLGTPVTLSSAPR